MSFRQPSYTVPLVAQRDSLAQHDSLASIGKRLRDERLRHDLTLDQLAELSGMSKAHLSRLESGDRQPSIAALLDLSGALETPVSTLLGENHEARAHEGAPIAITPAFTGAEPPVHAVNGLIFASLSGYPGSTVLESLRVTVDADRPISAPVRHDGEEWLYVLSGTLHLEYDDAIHELGEGAAAHFDAGRPHRLAAAGAPCEVLMITGHHSRDLHLIHR